MSSTILYFNPMIYCFNPCTFYLSVNKHLTTIWPVGKRRVAMDILAKRVELLCINLWLLFLLNYIPLSINSHNMHALDLTYSYVRMLIEQVNNEWPMPNQVTRTRPFLRTISYWHSVQNVLHQHRKVLYCITSIRKEQPDWTLKCGRGNYCSVT